MTNNIQAVLMKNWIAALEAENPMMDRAGTFDWSARKFIHIGWAKGDNVLFPADANVGYRLMDFGTLRRKWISARDIADAAIVRAMGC